MKTKKIKMLLVVVLIAVIVLGIGAKSCTNMFARSNDKYNVYNCNVKRFRLSTTIEISKDGKEWGKVKGDIFKLVEDPLTLYDANDKKIGYAGDAYKFFAQDSHGMYLNNEFKYDMVGQVDIFGETYKIYNKDEKKVAEASFDSINTSGKLYDSDKNIIATYESGFFSDDFNVKIRKDANIEDEIILMIFASYYSDYNYDSNSN